MKNKSSEWIDDLDKQLLVCREEIENLLFKRDMGLPVNLENIKQGYRRQNDILSDPKLLDKLNKFSIKTPKTKRKIEVLRRKIIEAKISDSPSFQYYQNYIQQEITDFFSRKNLTLSQRTQILKESEKREKRKECFSLMGLFLDKQENNFREMILLANKLARNENFSDFCSAKSFSEEVNLEDMARILYRAKKKTDKAWKQILKNIGKLTAGLLLLLLSSEIIVRLAVIFSQKLDVSPFFIGLLIIGLGNCLPEIQFSIAAIRAGQAWMALGNLMGSVIIISTLVLGTVALIAPIQIVDFSPFAVARFFLLLISLFFLIFIRTDRKITKKEGIFLFLLYIAFVIVEILLK